MKRKRTNKHDVGHTRRTSRGANTTKVVHGSKVPCKQHDHGESSFVVSIIDDDAIAVSDFMPPPNLKFALTKSL